MAEMQGALKLLAHADWDELTHEDLPGYLEPYFIAGELLCNSVPLPPNGTPFDATTKLHFDGPDAAKSSKEIFPSPIRPTQPHDDHASLQKNWGKPMKFSKKENPLDIALYKMAGHDRHGAWFARHNIFEGISYSKMKKAMLREFPETLLTQGQPGAGAIRGLAAERRVERIEVDNKGRVEVYYLSAQMPPPVSPRDFLTLFLTTSHGLSEKSPTGSQEGNTYIPRHFMVVSKALDHPDAPQRPSYVRGSYESVEIMREIPVHTAIGTDPELNPLEWIMVTRSDPAGGIPRFLIDRGTPGAMLADISKFLNWACGQEQIPDPDGDVEKQQQVSDQARAEFNEEEQTSTEQAAEKLREKSAAKLEKAAEQIKPDSAPAAAEESTRDVTAPSSTTQDQTQEGGVISTLTNAVQSGVNTYAPVPVANFVNNQLDPDRNAEDDLDDTSSDSSSSYLSANEMKRLSTAPEYLPGESMENDSISGGSTGATSSKIDKKNLSQHDKEVLKIMQRREKLDDKMAKKRQAEQAKFDQSQDKDQTEQEKAKERLDKEIKKTDERHQKEIEKLEAKREKELQKAEEKRRKREDQNKLSLVARERDDLRSQAELLRKENTLLAEQVENLQRENTALAGLVGKLGGPDALKSVQTGMKKSGSSASLTSAGRERSGTTASTGSGLSGLEKK